MRALITGVGGFAGRHLAAWLGERGDEVWGLCKPGTPCPAAVRCRESDIRDPDGVAEAVRQARPELIYHLAGLSHVGDSWSSGRDTLATNILGAVAVLEAARLAGTAPRVLLVGSAYQYGRFEGSGAIDESAPLRPVSPYGLSKVAQERLGRDYAGEGLPVILVRAFNHAGPGQEPSFVISDWARRIAEMELGRRPPVLEVGNLDVERDFTDVRDVARAYRLLGERGRPGEAYNVCSGVGRRLRDVLDTMRKLGRVEFSVVETRPPRPGEVRAFVGCRDKIGRELGWEPTVSFGDTLLGALEHWRRALARA
jgi:GDP-4-dehydro-6-deoxy-D-mannose reductase